MDWQQIIRPERVELGRIRISYYPAALLLQRCRRAENLLDVDKEPRNIVQNGFPHNLEVHIEIAMNESISHSDNIIPGYRRTVAPGRQTYPACRFSNDLEVFQDCQDEHAIMIEIGTNFSRGEPDGLGRSVSHVSKADEVSLVHV